jgi:hypothetical protein
VRFERSRRIPILFLTLAATVLVVAFAAPAAADGAQVIHRTAQCSIAFDGYTESLGFGYDDPECDVINIHRPNGGYTLIVHGQVIPEFMDRFLESGVRKYSAQWSEGECFAAYLFVVDEGHTPVWTDSVRRFTPDGKMTETCHYKPTN